MIKGYMNILCKKYKYSKKHPMLKSSAGMVVTFKTLFMVLIGTIILLTLKKLNLTKKELVWIKAYYEEYDENLLFLTYKIKNDKEHFDKSKVLLVEGNIYLNRDNGRCIIDPTDEGISVYWKDYGSISTKIMEV